MLNVKSCLLVLVSWKCVVLNYEHYLLILFLSASKDI